jgi:hypothetical protein
MKNAMNASDIMNFAAGLLQFAVAGYALRLNRVLGPRRVGWSLFAAFSLLALLHLIQSVAFFDVRGQSTIAADVIYSLISLLLLTGMAHVEGLFKERMRFEEEELRLRAALESEVEKKTIYLTRAIEGLEAEIDERKRMEAGLQAHIELLAAYRHPGSLHFDHETQQIQAAKQVSKKSEPDNAMPSLFESFADMIEFIPPGAIVDTLERESHMLIEDLRCNRPVPKDEADSILIFCRFVDVLRRGLPISIMDAALPASHLEFYRKTIDRLVQAGELPAAAPDEFDRCFCAGNLVPPLQFKASTSSEKSVGDKVILVGWQN